MHFFPPSPTVVNLTLLAVFGSPIIPFVHPPCGPESMDLASDLCRLHRTKCDGIQRCGKCSNSDAECVTINGIIARKITNALRMENLVQNMASQIESILEAVQQHPLHSNNPFPRASYFHGPPLVIDVTLDTHSFLAKLLDSYLTWIHPLLPIVDTLQASKVVHEIVDICSNNANTEAIIFSSCSNAVGLLVLALGELCIKGSHSDSSKFYMYGVRILEDTVGENSLEYVQATVLVAVYKMQLGNLLEGWARINKALEVLSKVSDNTGHHSLVSLICWYLR
jgi:hypothetical protein